MARGGAAAFTHGAECGASKAQASAHGLLYPMWVLPVQTALGLKDLPPHQDLRAKGQVLEFVMGVMVAIFVSHQWMSFAHPDPDMRQFRILQAALLNVFQGKVRVQGDALHQGINKTLLKMTDTQVVELQSAYIWYDWFSCPQMAARAEGQVVPPELQDCVDSIAAYVQLCNYFMVTVEAALSTHISSSAAKVMGPNLAHYDLPEVECSYHRWRTRGWCRLELFAWVLADCKPPIILIQSPSMVHFTNAMDWLDDVPGAGQLTVETDRDRILDQTRDLLDHKLQVLRRRADLHEWRFFKAVRGRILQGSSEKFGHSDVGAFLREYELESAVGSPKQGAGAGWSPLHYAAIAGGSVVSELVALRCDPNSRTQTSFPTAMILPGTTAMYLAAALGPESSVMALLELRGDPSLVNSAGHNALMVHARSPLAKPHLLPLFVQAGVDINQSLKWPALTTALHLAAKNSNATVVSALLELRADASRVGLGGNALAIACLGDNADSVRLLLRQRMDPNFQHDARGTALWGICMAARAAVRLGGGSDLLNIVCIFDGGTPLMYAAHPGNALAVRLLLAAKADARKRTSDGLTAADIAARNGHAAVALVLEEAARTAPALAVAPAAAPPWPWACACAPRDEGIELEGCQELAMHAELELCHVEV